MAYVTKRVIAMGYPATGFESVYRNSLAEVIRFFNTYHNDNVKVYNLCLEKERIYEKKFFNKSLVGLFPSKDHNPCPIKLILEFCVDIILYLIKNPNGVAAIHCKAGKGRTGVMICSYLIFSGLCKNADHALEHYALARTYNKKVKNALYRELLLLVR
jgi:phosphatidylinositol-3,4,5-trisphosphate 3-phosphatase/dual-specificity protein phosphatase PTEN